MDPYYPSFPDQPGEKDMQYDFKPIDQGGMVVKVFDPLIQDADIQAALAQWTNICGAVGDQNKVCCPKFTWIITTDDFNALWDGKLTDPFASEITPAWTKMPDLDGNSCEYQCPPSDDLDGQGRLNSGKTKDHIYLNETSDFEYPGITGNNFNGMKQAMFTGRTMPNVGNGHTLISFYQIVTHELGHFFGLPHSDKNPCCKHDKCMIMNDGVDPNQNAKDLSCDDMCMYKLLYCPDAPGNPCPSGSRQCDPPTLTSDCVSSMYYKGILPLSSDPVCTQTFNLVSPPIFGVKEIAFNLFPNPANHGCTISFSVPELANVKLNIFNNAGEEVYTGVDRFNKQGKYSMEIDCKKLSSGGYYCRLQVGATVVTRKLIIKH